MPVDQGDETGYDLTNCGRDARTARYAGGSWS